jgi:hypothetical protein
MKIKDVPAKRIRVLAAEKGLPGVAWFQRKRAASHAETEREREKVRVIHP